VILITACSSSRRIRTGQPAGEADSLPALPLSTIDIPVRINARPLLARAEAMVAREFNSPGWPNYVQPSCELRYKYRFTRSGLGVNCQQNNLSVEFTGNYQVTGGRSICSLGRPVSPWVTGSCGFGSEPLRRVNIGISSQLAFLPSFQLRSATHLSQLQAVDKCQVSFLATDITAEVLDSIRSSVLYFCRSLDQTLASTDFSGIRHASEKLLSRTSLGKYGWLLVHPMAIRAGPLSFATDSFSFSLGLTCHPELSPDSTRHVAGLSFPSLDQLENPGGIQIYLDAAYDYGFLSRLISDTLRKKAFEVNGRTIIVEDVAVKSIPNRQLELRLDFSGSNKGSIFIRGTPILDSARQTLTVPDISYSLESSDLLLKIARTFFRNRIRKSIQGKTYLDVGSLVRTNMPALDTLLNRPISRNLNAKGRARDIRLLALRAEAGQLEVQVYIRADLAILCSGQF